MRTLLLGLLFSTHVFAALCESDENYWLNHDTLFFGGTKLTDDLYPTILKVPVACKHLFKTCIWSPQFAKSKRHVFFKAQEVSGADPASFEYICDDFARDKYKVYKKDRVFLKRDPKSFTLDEVSGVYRYGSRTYGRDGKRQN